MSALQRLLDYIDDEQARRCQDILDQATDEANEILKEARGKANALVHDAVSHEKRRRARDTERARAEVQLRLRRAWFRLIRRELDTGWPVLRQAMIDHWQASAGNRRDWLAATLDTATHALGPGLWHVEHPQDWAMVEGAPVFKSLKDKFEVLEIHCKPVDAPAGFRVTCSDVSVSTTIDGLLARRGRIEGLWLARLHDHDGLRLP